MRQLVAVLGDQLDAAAAMFDEFDPGRDAVWMAEVEHGTEGSASRARGLRRDVAEVRRQPQMGRQELFG